MFDISLGDGETVQGYQKFDNVTVEALTLFNGVYGSINTDDIFNYVYGLLHSPEYRETYAADLRKTLPRIPLTKLNS
jgi:predicted helicase